MRLTLRTLLAYLDNTLEPEDAAILSDKLTESGFATQLVQRIRGSLTNNQLTAPPPDSTHPIGEANVISEYLDSTLTPEQIAEIERACLESEPHLAEAAACHQILTMVLGKPAEVSDSLRQRIYLLPDTQKGKPPVSGSFSSVSIPPDGQLDLMPTDTSMGSEFQPAGRTIQPVGPGDSGVSDAPTRLRESGTLDDETDKSSDSAISGSRDRVGVSDIYGGSIRSSHITPWLVSLALAGVLLFVLVQIFSPLLREPTAKVEPADDRVSSLDESSDVDVNEPPEIEADVTETPVMKAVGVPAVDIDVSPEPSTVEEADVEEMTLPPPSQDSDDPVEAIPPPAVVAEQMPAPRVTVETTELPAAEPLARAPEPAPMPAPATDAVATAPAVPMSDDADTETVPVLGTEKKAVAAVPPPVPSVDPKVDPPAEQHVDGLATATGAKTLLIGRVADDNWVRIAKDTMIGDRVKLVNAPGFRSPMTTAAGDVVTLIDAGSASLMKDPDGGHAHGLSIAYGRALVTSKKQDTSILLMLGDLPVKVMMPEPEMVLGVEVSYLRQPGTDPRNPANRTRLTRLFSVQGNIEFESGTANGSLVTGQQWVARGNAFEPATAMDAIPAWVNVSDPADDFIDSEARKGLLELIEIDQPLELSLLEATSFRRSEVGALAAQTLLLIGNSSAYFGGDGALSDPKQRTYWPVLVRALRDSIDRDAQAAEKLSTDITEMDAADGKTLYRLLVGYSQKQLVEGDDEELVDMLESGSMGVRVMAIESLRDITGTTLNYRAEENLTRRNQAIKKWRTRQRKGDIKRE